MDDWWTDLAPGHRFWLWPLTLAVANPVVAFVTNLIHLWRRSRRLE